MKTNSESKCREIQGKICGILAIVGDSSINSIIQEKISRKEFAAKACNIWGAVVKGRKHHLTPVIKDTLEDRDRDRDIVEDLLTLKVLCYLQSEKTWVIIVQN